MQLYRIWGYVLFFPPFLSFLITEGIDLMYTLGWMGESLGTKILYVIPYFTEVAFLLFALICTGIFIGNKALTISGTVALPVMMGFFFLGTAGLASSTLGEVSALYAHILVVESICLILLDLSYLLIGLYLLPKRNRKLEDLEQ